MKEKTFKCGLCFSNFTEKSDLKSHIESHIRQISTLGAKMIPRKRKKNIVKAFQRATKNTWTIQTFFRMRYVGSLSFRDRIRTRYFFGYEAKIYFLVLRGKNLYFSQL